MSVLTQIEAFAADLTAIRRDIHAHPEIGFEEVRTSALVARELKAYGVDEIHTGIGKTGVVGIIRGKRDGARMVGLRADMDALPMDETTNLPFASKNPGRFHGCGHDGHTTMLLGAARYLTQTRDFAGAVALIFQPAEEGLGGARAMIADGLFKRFPCNEVYALHNWPSGPAGRVAIRQGPMMAGADFFDIRIQGRGSHGAKPEFARDPVIVATTIAQALQTIVSRNADPLKAAVVSVTKIHAGSAYNVIPDTAEMGGTIRAFDNELRAMISARMREIVAGIAAAFGVSAEVDIRDIFSALENAPEQTDALADTAKELFGAAVVNTDAPLVMGSEDFADMTQAAPGAYALLTGATGPMVHNPGYMFDDSILPKGAALLARVAEKRLA